jgi:hypothetical protein
MSQTASLTEFTKRSFFEMMKSVATSIPGHVIAFDPVTQHAQIQIGVVRKDVNGVEFTPTPLIEVPVQFIGGASHFVEFEINTGDEGVILFSQRCIDGWKTTGGVANAPMLRFHDINDAVFVTGVRSQPNVITDHENDGIRVRNTAGTHHVWLKKDGTITTVNENSTLVQSPNGALSYTNNGGSFTVSAGGAFNGEFTSFNVNSSSFTHNGTNVGDTHTHAKGSYKDAEDRPLLSGNSEVPT